jgi:hypothetical protein
VYFFHEFLQVLQIRRFLTQNLDYPRRNQRYSLAQMILALVYPLVLGLDRLETASFLRSNGTFQYLTGLRSFPDPQTLRRFCCRLLTHSCGRCTAQMIDCCRTSSTYRAIDLD